ncbi:MAG: alpha-L-fucosidase [Verrucomicrobiota bacterium]
MDRLKSLKTFGLLALLAAALTYPLPAAETNAEPHKPLPRVLLIGDSIRGGYGKGVQQLLAGKAEVLLNPGNAQYTGYGVNKIDEWLGDGKWDVIHFNWGLWDMYGWEYDKEDRSPEKYAERLETLVTRMEKTGAKLIWATTTPVCPEPEKTMRDRFNKRVKITPEIQKQYQDAALRVMEKHHVAIDDLHALIQPDLKKYQLGVDDVHFNATGCERLSQKVEESILSTLVSGTSATETKEARDARMAWWREARFGMFVHWGLYSGLAGTWQGKSAGQGGMEWIQQKVKVDTDTYAKAAIPLFKPKPGFAREWAKMAKAAGCRYLVFTTKHHEGFALHDSKVSDYDAGSILQRDLVKEIVEACRAEGLRIGFYHSVIDWHHDQYEYARSKTLPHPFKGKTYPNGQRDHAKYVDYLHAEVNELMSNYGPVDILWWDFSHPDFQGQEAWRAFDLIKLVRDKQPGIIMNNRLFRTEAAGWNLRTGNGGSNLDTTFGDFITPEQHIPATGIPGVDWETCMTMNGTWGYSDHDQAWKTPEDLIRKLIDIASKGGNYLLNIGPKGDGSIPQESVDCLAEIGRWLKVNGEAIYGTSATAFGNELGKPVKGKTGYGEEAEVSSANDWRCTTKPGKIYLHIFNWPANGKFELPSMRNKITKAYLLAGNQELKLNQTTTGATLDLPHSAPDQIASVICLEIEDSKTKVSP